MVSEIIQKIEFQRKMMNIRKKELALGAGISSGYYAKILRGASSPTLGVVEAMCGIVGVRLVVYLK